MPLHTSLATSLFLAGSATGKPELNTIVEDAAVSRKSKKVSMHRIIDASVDVDATPEEVWAVLTDFRSWETWNDFIPAVVGNLKEGERLRIKVVSPGLKPMSFKPEVYVVHPLQAIVWGGSFLKVIYRGDHTFLLEPLPDGKTRFRQIERFMGPMVLFMGGMIKKTEVGYHQMNRALKEQVEIRTRENNFPSE
jgi:hypothetical protein